MLSQSSGHEDVESEGHVRQEEGDHGHGHGHGHEHEHEHEEAHGDEDGDKDECLRLCSTSSRGSPGFQRLLSRPSMSAREGGGNHGQSQVGNDVEASRDGAHVSPLRDRAGLFSPSQSSFQGGAAGTWRPGPRGGRGWRRGSGLRGRLTWVE